MTDTASVTVWLAETRAKIGLAEYGGPDDADGLIPVAQTLLAVVEKVLDIHGPTSAMSWCKACGTSYPCTTRREIIAALLGETVDD